MCLSSCGVLALLLVLTNVSGDRRRLQCDRSTGRKEHVAEPWSASHYKARNGTRDILFPAALLNDTHFVHSLVGRARAVYFAEKDSMFAFVLGIGVLLVLFMFVSIWICPQNAARKQNEPSNKTIESGESVTLVISRDSGEELVTLRANRNWSGRSVCDEVAKHAKHDEYLCQLVWDNRDGFEIALSDFQYIDENVGPKLRAIIRSCCSVPSGESVFVGTKIVGACRQTARIWLYEDMSAIMTCVSDAGIVETKTMQGHLDKAGTVNFSSGGLKVSGKLQGMYGRQEIALLEVPMLGSVKLKQSLVEAVFDVSQGMPCKGWITFFCAGEVVLRTWGLGDGSKTSTHLCLWWRREKIDSAGSSKITFNCVGDAYDWKENFDRGGAELLASCSGSWSGPIGKRKVLLFNFPSVGNVELVEHPIS